VRREARVKRILIVEDSATMRSLIVASLEELAVPVKIVEAKSGFEALRLLPRETFDLVVTDINMPDINGLELINFVKKNPHYRETPLFIVTTEGRDQDRERGLALGASEYVTKPFDPAALTQLARRYLGL
jgi:two-component system chemotaxis response regulator CheY